ncbi:hypothetical protein [Streptomyces purpureus]|uniref:Lipoprotein n=1 Tax=Streptomyces purpureus TaxID=1951 RepID=A0A918GXU7_9ACTN|nr:hypothetical protein [Streptomyces purpureus]GGT12751.1 hypothetical protein GCM10014713_01470 [Streptomyces purpureus]
MRGFHRRPARVAAVVTAALLALSACSSGSDDKAKADPPPSPAASVDAPDPQSSPEAAPSPSASKGPVLPDAKITPATGSFTKAQKKFLEGRVPASMDPAAVLQTGDESCQRLARTAKRDKDAAVGAIIAGDIPDAADVVEHLCPEQKPLVTAASKGFPDGTKNRPAAGTYRALTTDPACSWRAVGSGGKVLASGPAAGADGTVKAKVPAGTKEFTSTGCYAWLPA